MITLTNLSTVAVLLITLGAFFIHRSAIKRARSFKLGREEGKREAARDQSELERLTLAMSGSAVPPKAGPGPRSHIKPTMMSALIERIETEARSLSRSGLEPLTEMAALKHASRSVTPPVIPQTSPPYSIEDVPRGPHSEQAKD